MFVCCAFDFVLLPQLCMYLQLSVWVDVMSEDHTTTEKYCNILVRIEGNGFSFTDTEAHRPLFKLCSDVRMFVRI